MKAIFMAEKEKEERNNFIFFTYMGFLIECPHPRASFLNTLEDLEP
jgi:hypothetical protein